MENESFKRNGKRRARMASSGQPVMTFEVQIDRSRLRAGTRPFPAASCQGKRRGGSRRCLDGTAGSSAAPGGAAGTPQVTPSPLCRVMAPLHTAGSGNTHDPESARSRTGERELEPRYSPIPNEPHAGGHGVVAILGCCTIKAGLWPKFRRSSRW